MTKIGLVLEAHPHDGGKFQHSIAVLDAVAALPRDRYTVIIVYFHSAWEPYVSAVAARSWRVRRTFWKWFYDRVWRNLRLPIGIWRSLSALLVPTARAFLAERCDVWFCPTESTLTYQLPVSFLSTIFDLMHRYEPQFPEVSAYGRGRRRDRHFSSMCRYARGIIVDSEVGKKQVIESYRLDPRRIHVLPYVAPHYITDTSVEEKALPYCLPAKYLFYPAQFWAHKNHTRLIQAVHKLRTSIPDIRLVLAGSKKNAYKAVEQLVRELNLDNAVSFLGYVPDDHMPALYRRAHALIMPTLFGPTNIPPLEAFAVGCPVAVSRIYAMPEQLGNAAIYFDPLSVEEIASCIEMLWCDNTLWRDLKDRGKDHARTWSQSNFNSRFRQIIDTALDVHAC